MKIQRYTLEVIFLIGLLLISWLTLAENLSHHQQNILSNVENISDQIQTGKLKIKDIPNPHFSDEGCKACHSQTPNQEDLFLRNPSYDIVCKNCHKYLTRHDYIHPTGIVPNKEMQLRMDSEMSAAIKRSEGKVSCISCHEMNIQCDKYRSFEQKVNPFFLRKNSFKPRTAICFQCHDKDAYKKLNPHLQMDKQGNLIVETCSICHKTLDNIAGKTSHNIDFNISQDFNKMCTACHENIPHPSSQFSISSKKKVVSHLGLIPKDMKAYYNGYKKQTGRSLPLESNGEIIHCATCHNPHQKGVFKNEEMNVGADSKQRLRYEDICIFCHNI